MNIYVYFIHIFTYLFIYCIKAVIGKGRVGCALLKMAYAGPGKIRVVTYVYICPGTTILLFVDMLVVCVSVFR